MKPEAVKLMKQNTDVDAEVWRSIYLKTNRANEEAAASVLYNWCQAAFKNQAFNVGLSSVRAEVSRLEETSRSLKEEVLFLSYKFLSSFDSLTTVEKCALKLAVSNMIDLNNKIFANQYKKHFSIRNFSELLLLKAPRPEKDHEDEIRREFGHFKKLFFEDEAAPQFLPNIKKGTKHQICLVLMNMMNMMNMMNTWSNEDEDENEEVEKKRKRKIDHSENDVLLVVKMILDTIFGDTKLKWKSGEKTTDATKRARIVGQLLSGGTSCSNLMGRRSDLVLYNKNNVVLCLSELKDGNSESSSTKQESKSLRYSKSLLSYNKPFSQKDIWSPDWNGIFVNVALMFF
ncbi:hypothetical protein EDC96DRAFT_115695 [Choanephora cucurbitarum]|nr:hypothetical protein EDC96DRAFT_115695 [Choanephora cucurbitarum]